jgi:hypothetical protein
MASPTENEPNPYEAPTADLHQPVDLAGKEIDRTLVKKFRDQIIALGAVWLFLGFVAAAMAGVLMFGAPGNLNLGAGGAPGLLLAVLGVMGLVWLIVGVFTCMKQMWAVYTGLVLSYLSLIGQVFNLNICSLVILIVVILQAHRVIGFANQMRAAGIPLTTRPGSLSPGRQWEQK